MSVALPSADANGIPNVSSCGNVASVTSKLTCPAPPPLTSVLMPTSTVAVASGNAICNAVIGSMPESGSAISVKRPRPTVAAPVCTPISTVWVGRSEPAHWMLASHASARAASATRDT